MACQNFGMTSSGKPASDDEESLQYYTGWLIICYRDLTELIKKRAIQWMTDRVLDITNAIQEAPKKPDNWQEVIADVNELSEVIPDWSLPTIKS